MKLHNYFRSSASYRVRIALNLKGLSFEYCSVHLTRDGGEQFSQAFRELNLLSLVPVLEDGAERLTQSLAIIEYLNETYPEPPLLPQRPAERARVRGLALSVACEIHPLNNLRVLNYLTRELGVSSEARTSWYRHWVELGLAALEAEIAKGPAGRFCHGDAPGLADCCLIPQLFNARRFHCDVTRYPRLLLIEESCQVLRAFRDAAPERQPDAES
jgi:maleylacetoacetate isomerase/maleylpyruvate isomerase